MSPADAETAVEVSIVIPVLNEEENIGALMGELDAALADLAHPYELIFVDDGCTDRTQDLLREAMATRPNIRVLVHETSQGKSEALRTAARYMKGRLMLTLDGDLQNNPAEIPTLLATFHAAEAEGGSPLGLLAGERVTREDPFPRNLVSKLGNGIRSRALRDGTRDTACGYKIIRRDLFLAMPFFSGLHRFLPSLAVREGFRVIHAPVTHRARYAGVAKYNTWNRLWVSIGDLGTVYWLIRRYNGPERVLEIGKTREDDTCLPPRLSG